MKLLRSPYAVWLLLSLLVFTLIVTLRLFGLLQPMELTAYDTLLRVRQQATPIDPRIALVTITENDIKRFGYPINDDTMTELLRRVNAAQAKVIGVDIYRDLPVPPGYEAFDAYLRETRNIVWITKFGDVPPPQALIGTDQIGANDIPDDPGGIIRRGLLFLDDGQEFVWSFAMMLAMQYLQQGPQGAPDNPDWLQFGQTVIPPLERNAGAYIGLDAGGYQFLLDYQGMAQPFPRVSLSQVMDGQIPEGLFKDRIVLIGITAASVNDYFYTPFSLGRSHDPRTYGVVLQAYITSQILRLAGGESPRLHSPVEALEVGWILLWTLGGGLLGLWARSLAHFTLIGLAGLTGLTLICYGALTTGWWIPLAPAGLGWLLGAGLITAYMSNQEKADRALLMQLFSKHVSSDVAEMMWDQREVLLKEGRLRPARLTATVLFTDLVGFTTISEKMQPQILMDWLNIYMDAMSQQVLNHQGVIDKFIGDAIMAVFGVPLPRKTDADIARDAVNAVNCALAMNARLLELNAQWQAQDQPTMGMRVGIYTGELVAGSLGGGQRSEYTVIGDTVNTASRLESFDKSVSAPGMPCRIMIGEPTLKLLNGAFQTVEVGAVQLKGKGAAVSVYLVTGRAGDEQATAAAAAVESAA